jgi:putative tryptophan/tyrosine transport system substrate-binding protein
MLYQKFTMKNFIIPLLLASFLMGCESKKSDVPTVAFMDAFQDNTIEKAKQGFFAALAENGFDEKKGTLNVIYRNAQGDIPTLTQIAKYMISQKPTLIATCPTLATITAVQNTKDIPIFMMVSETVERLQVKSKLDGYPKNLFGVGETLAYVDTSVSLIPKLIKPKGQTIKMGLVFNQSEPQSVQALEEIQKVATANNIEVVALPVNSSADVQLVTQSLLSKDIDVFFANPDNTIFASFESILKACEAKNVPIMTSEAGLVSRGALAAYGPDMYEWGYQSGLQAAQLLKTGTTDGIAPTMVKTRNRVYNPAMAKKYNITIPEGYKPL